jgi:hypothetical protein
MAQANKVASLNDILATRMKMSFKYRVDFSTFGYEDFHKAKEWCETNCEGIWHIESVHALYFQFDSERDVTMFMLKWSGKGKIK